MSVRLDRRNFILPMTLADTSLERAFGGRSLRGARRAIRNQKAFSQITESIYDLFTGASHVSTHAAPLFIDDLILYELRYGPYRAIFRYDDKTFEQFGLAFIEEERLGFPHRRRGTRAMMAAWSRRRR